MSIPNTRDRKVRPTHPGEMLREDFMPDCTGYLFMSQKGGKIG
jgi:hypothetical protein